MTDKHESMKKHGSGLAWLVFGTVALAVLIYSLVFVGDWTLERMTSPSPATFVMCLCAAMAVLTAWLGLRCFMLHRSHRFWWWGTAFFVMTWVQAFFTRGG